MGMTIDDSIELFEDNFTVIDTHGYYTEEEETQATAIAIETMRKYQKIEEIVGNYGFDTSWLCLKKIREVMEDRNDDQHN